MISPMVDEYLDRLHQEFDIVYDYEGNDASSCDGEYFLSESDSIVTDGITHDLSKYALITVVRGASFVIIIGLNNHAKGENVPFLDLRVDRSKLNYAIYDKIIKSKQNILEYYQSIKEFISKRI